MTVTADVLLSRETDYCDTSELDMSDLCPLTSTDFPPSQESELETLISGAQAMTNDGGSFDDQIHPQVSEPSNNMISVSSG